MGENAEVDLTADNFSDDFVHSILENIEDRLRDMMSLPKDKDVHAVWLATRGSLMDNYEGEEEKSSYLIPPGHGVILFSSGDPDEYEDFDIFVATKQPYENYEI